MSLLSLAFEQRTHPAAIDAEWLRSLGLRQSDAGVDVTEQSALQSMAVFGCVRILAESVASLPLLLYQRLASGGKDRATGHPLYTLLHDLPNPEMTSIELRETLMGHLGLWGNAYCEIEQNNAGRVMGLWPLRPDKTKKKRVEGRLQYGVTLPTGEERTLPAERVMHIRGLGYDGMVGYSPIALARQAIGLAQATEEFGARFFGNGARPGIMLQHPGKLSDEAHKRLQTSFETRHQGLEHSHRIAILEEGMTVEQVGIPPEDAQFIATRRFQTEEIARLYRVPPHMLADLERATFSNIEELGIEFVTLTLTPWLVRWEQAIYRDLLTEKERTTLFAEHLVAGLLRGNIQSRYQAYATGRQNGFLSANDIRDFENMNPVEGGDIYLVPLNMVPVDQIGGGPTPGAPTTTRSASSTRDAGQVCDCGEERAGANPAPTNGGTNHETRSRNIGKGRVRLAKAYQRVFQDATGRVIRREVADVRRGLRKFYGQRDSQQFIDWLTTFYREHREFWKRQMLPILLAYADQVGVSVADELGIEPQTAEDIRKFIEQYVEALAYRETDSSFGQLRALIEKALAENGDPEVLVEERLAGWEETRPGKVADHETRNSLGAFVVAFYLSSRIVERMVWMSMGKSCPFCQGLDGKVVGIEEVFVGKGEELSGEGEETLSRRTDVSHPPIHSGCDCVVVADL